MTLNELENLAKVGKLKRESFSQPEFDGLLKSGAARLADAANSSLASESRFDLAYNAAHALALAALRYREYRSDNRYIVFQVLPHTLGSAAPIWRVLAAAHQRRNVAEYEGAVEVDERLLSDMVMAAQTVLAAVRSLPKKP